MKSLSVCVCVCLCVSIVFRFIGTHDDHQRRSINFRNGHFFLFWALNFISIITPQTHGQYIRMNDRKIKRERERKIRQTDLWVLKIIDSNLAQKKRIRMMKALEAKKTKATNERAVGIDFSSQNRCSQMLGASFSMMIMLNFF